MRHSCRLSLQWRGHCACMHVLRLQGRGKPAASLMPQYPSSPPPCFCCCCCCFLPCCFCCFACGAACCWSAAAATSTSAAACTRLLQRLMALLLHGCRLLGLLLMLRRDTCSCSNAARGWRWWHSAPLPSEAAPKLLAIDLSSRNVLTVGGNWVAGLSSTQLRQLVSATAAATLLVALVPMLKQCR